MAKMNKPRLPEEFEAVFKSFAHSSSEAFVLLDENLNCLSINPAGAKLLGASEAALLGKNIQDVVPDIKETGRYDKYLNVIKTGKPLQDSNIVPHPKFGDIHLSIRAFKVGTRLGLIVTDITRLKNVEERLRQSERSYRLLFDSAIDGMFVIDAETMKVVLSNEAGRKMGLLNAVNDVSKVNPLDFIHPDDKERVARIIAEDIFEKDLRQVNEFRVVTRDGKEIWLSAVGRRIQYQGRLAGLFSIRNVTELKIIEGALRRSEEFFRSVIENALDGIVVLTTDGTVSYASPSTERVLGYTQEEQIGANWFKFTSPDEILAKTEMFKDLIQSPGATVRAESYIKRKDGSLIIVEATGRPIVNNGKLEGILVNWRDITERKRMEEELRSSREQLRNLSTHLQSVREEERTLVAREIHDELGQTLTALKMDLSWLSKRLSAEQEPLLKKTRAMLELTDTAIHTVKTISAELRPGILDDLGLEDAIEWLTEEFQNRAGVECEFISSPGAIVLDQGRTTAIFRILQEALTNIARHAGATKVNVSLQQKADSLLLKVKDNGTGIAKEQISSPTSFGLIGMQERARSWGGEVGIRGVRSKGTTVIASIPLNTKREGQ